MTECATRYVVERMPRNVRKPTERKEYLRQLGTELTDADRSGTTQA